MAICKKVSGPDDVMTFCRKEKPMGKEFLIKEGAFRLRKDQKDDIIKKDVFIFASVGENA